MMCVLKYNAETDENIITRIRNEKKERKRRTRRMSPQVLGVPLIAGEEHRDRRMEEATI